MAILTLNQADLSSDCWKKVEKFLNDELQDLRVRNDGNLDAEKTADIRGQIKLAKAMLQVAKPKTEIRPVAHPSSA